MKYDYDKFKSLEISQEEIDSIRKYISYMHTNMNSMLDLNPEVLTKLKDKAWVIDLSKDNIKEHIESFEKIYSAMYKYGKKHGGPHDKLYRGTSRDEIDKLKQGDNYGRFLSTTTDETVAHTFVEYGNGAVVSMQLGNDIPHLKMDEFLGETQVSEKEILLAPYCKVGNITSFMNPPEGESRRYMMGLSKSEFKNISDEERAKCEELINSFDLNEELVKYKHWKEELEAGDFRLAKLTPQEKKDDLELVQYLSEQRNKARDEYENINYRFKDIKNAMNVYLQDKFKTIELEIEKEIKKEEVIKDEEFRVNKVEEFKNSREKLLEKAESVFKLVEDTQDKYFGQDEEEVALNELANNTNTFVGSENKSEQEIVNRFETLKNNIEIIKNDIESMEISDDLTMEEMAIKGELMSQVNEKYSQLEMIDNLMAECQRNIGAEKTENKSEIDRKIAEKIKSSMINKAMSDLAAQRETLVTKKDSIIDRITGKAKLKKAQVENLNLKIKTIGENGLNIPDNIKGVENYLKKYSQVLGIENLPTDAQVILKNSLKNIEMPELTEEDRKEFELYFNPNMPTIADKKLSKKDMIRSITEQNERLSQIKSNDSREVQNSDFDKNLYNNTDKYNIEDTLDMAITYTNKDGRTMDQKREELKKNRTMDLFNKF